MFIAFEGPDGVGKTTIIKKLMQDVRFVKYKFITPFSTDIGVSIKKLLNDPLFYNVCETTKIELMSKVFLDTEEKFLKSKTLDYLIIDRWVASFFAYQDVPNNPFAQEMFGQYFDYSLGILTRPDYTFYLKADNSILIERLRLKADRDQLDAYFENKLNQINHNYDLYIDKYEKSDKYSIIYNNDFSPDVYEEISNTIVNLI